jgi:SAM-dependent methyltransferase
MSASSLERFRHLSYDEFRRRAADPSLSAAEKIGFPDSYRAGRSEQILADLLAKLPALAGRRCRVLDIGPGCGELAEAIIQLCQSHSHELVLVDSPEMLAHIPDRPGVTRYEGRFPQAIDDADLAPFDVILCYSVLQYVFADGNLFDFVDRSLRLLAEGGRLLLGDIPNVSMRKRFFHSSNGVRFHQEFMQTNDPPVVEHLCLEEGQIDDGSLMGLMQRCRGFGYHAWLLPQSANLPMANRREDLLVERP